MIHHRQVEEDMYFEAAAKPVPSHWKSVCSIWLQQVLNKCWLAETWAHHEGEKQDQAPKVTNTLRSMARL